MHKPHSALELTLLNHWQRGFPLDREPFAAIGRCVGVDASAVLAHYARLQDQGSFSRIGAVFAPGAGGASLLAAMAVPPDRLERVAIDVSRHAGVNHNYRREHRYNLWFVASSTDEAALARLSALETER